MGVFSFIDEITELKPGECLTAIYHLSGREEFLKDHFPVFPVMPGVLLLESLKQAAAALLASGEKKNGSFYRMTLAEDVKFGQFVKPGSRLKIFVKYAEAADRQRFEGRIDLLSENGKPAGKALTAALRLEPASLAA